ncbi:MAG: hypothetical protein IKT01_07350 [Eubacteriaceae bacterium]|nr:hypothetical protein [Eubacteriaceae bacterium]
MKRVIDVIILAVLLCSLTCGCAGRIMGNSDLIFFSDSEEVPGYTVKVTGSDELFIGELSCWSQSQGFGLYVRNNIGDGKPNYIGIFDSKGNKSLFSDESMFARAAVDGEDGSIYYSVYDRNTLSASLLRTTVQGRQKTVTVRDITGSKLIFCASGGTLVYSDDEGRLMILDGEEPETLYVFEDGETAEEMLPADPENAVYVLTSSSDGGRLIRLDIPEGKPEVIAEDVCGMALDENCGLIYMSNGKTEKLLFAYRDGESVRLRSLPEDADSFAVSPGGEYIAYSLKLRGRGAVCICLTAGNEESSFIYAGESITGPVIFTAEGCIIFTRLVPLAGAITPTVTSVSIKVINNNDTEGNK